MRPTVLPWVQFLTALVMNSWLGMMTLARSKVSISVARMLIRRTQPSSFLTTTQSPTRTERSANRMMPEMKFATTACRPKPMPTDSAPAIRAIFCRSMPSAPNASAPKAISAP